MITVKGKEFTNLKEAQDYAASQMDASEVKEVAADIKTTDEMNGVIIPAQAAPELSTEQTEAIDLAAQVDSLTDEDPELAEELDAALDEDQTQVLTDAHDESAEAGA
jgi:hypothetical protein